MPEINDLLDAERNRRRPAARRARVALIVASAATVVALGTGATLAATAATSLIKHEEESSAVDDFVAPLLEQRTPTAEPSPSTNEPSATKPPGIAQPAQNEFGFPVYDASTDIATIPRPVDDHDPASTEIWLAQQGIIADCMQEKGLEYRYTGYWLVPPGVTWNNAKLRSMKPKGERQSSKHSTASPSSVQTILNRHPEYRWEDAGCVGYAVHVTGRDDAH